MARKPPAAPPPSMVPAVAPTPIPASSGPRKAFSSIPRFPHCAYSVDVEWRYLESHLRGHAETGLDMEPDFQREHVWTEEQQRAYIEYNLMGGEVGRNIVCVCTDWQTIPSPGYSILDGKQRLEAARKFMRGDLRIFADAARPEGYALGDFDGHMRLIQGRFSWQVVEVPTRAHALALYLKINTGGTPHSPEEIARVRAMLDAELAKETS